MIVDQQRQLHVKLGIGDDGQRIVLQNAAARLLYNEEGALKKNSDTADYLLQQRRETVVSV